MFTGIVEAVGRIAAMERVEGDLRIEVTFAPEGSPNTAGATVGRDRSAPAHFSSGFSPSASSATGRSAAVHPRPAVAANGRSCSPPWADPLKLGESIAVSGVCLTVVAFDEHGFSADVSTETLARTTLGDKRVGDLVNLERALLPTTRLGGHLVAGHVDGVGAVAAIQPDARAQRWRFSAPRALLRFIAEKGSVAVDGVSLTVNGVEDSGFEVALIPHTVAHTAFSTTSVGDAVNLEVDLIARYVARLNA